MKAASTFGAMSRRTFEEEWTCCGWGGFLPVSSLSSSVRSMKVTRLFLDAFELLGTVRGFESSSLLMFMVHREWFRALETGKRKNNEFCQFTIQVRKQNCCCLCIISPKRLRGAFSQPPFQMSQFVVITQIKSLFFDLLSFWEPLMHCWISFHLDYLVCLMPGDLW